MNASNQTDNQQPAKSNQSEKPLTFRQKMWVEHVLQGESPREAAIAVGYSKSTAKTYSFSLLKSPRIQQHIKARFEEAGIQPNVIIGTLFSILLSDVTDFIDDETGKLMTLEQIKNSDRGHWIKEIVITTTTTPLPDGSTKTTKHTTIKLYSSIEAAKVLAKILKVGNRRDDKEGAIRAFHKLRAKYPQLNPSLIADKITQAFNMDKSVLSNELKSITENIEVEDEKNTNSTNT